MTQNLGSRYVQLYVHKPLRRLRTLRLKKNIYIYLVLIHTLQLILYSSSFALQIFYYSIPSTVLVKIALLMSISDLHVIVLYILNTHFVSCLNWEYSDCCIRNEHQSCAMFILNSLFFVYINKCVFSVFNLSNYCKLNTCDIHYSVHVASHDVFINIL